MRLPTCCVQSLVYLGIGVGWIPEVGIKLSTGADPDRACVLPTLARWEVGVLGHLSWSLSGALQPAVHPSEVWWSVWPGVLPLCRPGSLGHS